MDFTTALSSYRQLDLPSLQAHLAAVVEPQTESQTRSLQSRKRLADQTREFKKLEDAEKLNSVKALLKAYQGEIDDLTKRAREAEAGVRLAEERLTGVQDPVRIMEKVVDQTAELAEVDGIRAQNKKLASDNAELKEKLQGHASLQADRDELSERVVHLETTMESRVEEARKSVEAEIGARYDERLNNATSKEAGLNRSLSLAQEQLKQLRSSHESTTQRLLSSTSGTGSGGAAASSSAEYEMLAADLQRANERVAHVERRNEELREEVEKVKSGRAEKSRVVEMQSKLDKQEAARVKLQAELDSWEEKHRAALEQVEQQTRHIQSQMQEKVQENSTLQSRLAAQADYAEVKRELEIMRLVEFSDGIDDDDDEPANDGQEPSAYKVETPEPKQAKPFEALLLQKNKKLQDNLATLRVAHNEAAEALSTATKEVDSQKAEVARLSGLNEKLEADLLMVGASGSGTATAANGTASGRAPKQVDGASSAASQSAEEALAEMDRIEKEASAGVSNAAGPVAAAARAVPPMQGTEQAGLIKDSSTANVNPESRIQQQQQQPPSTKQESAASTATSSNNSTNSSLLPIVLSQRDRFRTRNAELEEELRKQFEVISTLRNDVKGLQSDNLSLYEKVRYLQSYGSRNGGGGDFGNGSEDQRHHTRVPMNIATGSATAASSGEDRWKTRYEQSMNPFEAFRGREQHRAFSSLNPLERLLHMFTRLVLADRRMRIFFVLYFVGMHLFIFGILVDYTFWGSSAAGGAAAAAVAANNGAGSCGAPGEGAPQDPAPGYGRRVR
ncbi:unnamed protein product [Jaminaea pallidilutea]